MLFGAVAALLTIAAIKGFELFAYVMVVCNVLSFFRSIWENYEEELLETAEKA